MNEEKAKEYWRKNVVIIGTLLGIYVVVSLVGGIILAEPLFKITFGGVPFSFWIAHQGAILIFVALIFYYSWRLDKLDQEYGVSETKVIQQSKSISKG